MVDKSTVVGNIIDVQSGSITASLVEDKQGCVPIITIGDEDIIIGQIGSYVAIIQGDIKILAIITRMAEQEKLVPLEHGESRDEAIRMSFANRVVTLVPLGTINSKEEFERGVSSFPTTGAEVHAVGLEDINKIFSTCHAGRRASSACNCCKFHGGNVFRTGKSYSINF